VYSSAVMALYSIVSSRYSRRQAGHRPFRLVLMLLKQNWQIYFVTKMSVVSNRDTEGQGEGRGKQNLKYVPDSRMDTV